ncbi:glyoxalase superfamily protein [Micromonospora sp. NPDC048871]|uniref:glyoxalase superfamily protein n=1 Tax=Micromonospora sp. NPDC048871 TaxID=3364259 RepID=UPI003713BC4C
MDEHLAPALRVADADASARWYERLGFVKQWEHRFAPDLPRYVGIARAGMPRPPSSIRSAAPSWRSTPSPDTGTGWPPNAPATPSTRSCPHSGRRWQATCADQLVRRGGGGSSR